MKLKVPITMKRKLEPLLSHVPGEFAPRLRRVDGLDQLRCFKEHGVPCPDFTTSLKVAQDWVEAGDMVFGRNNEHEKGNDIVDQRSQAWASREFWSRVIVNVAKEYRLHVFDGDHIQQGLKRFDPTAPRKRTDDLPIRNTETGWRYDHAFGPPSSAVALATRAAQVLGYLWGAVDLLEDSGGNCFVLEVNTAPGMDDTTARAYAKAIEKYVVKAAS